MRRSLGMKFRKPAPLQRAIVALLDESPLPWTFEMLMIWFNQKGSGVIGEAINRQRIRRVALGVYTSASKYSAPRGHRRSYSRISVVTDDMLARYGYNL